jgi:hypothetical protein
MTMGMRRKGHQETQGERRRESDKRGDRGVRVRRRKTEG